MDKVQEISEDNNVVEEEISAEESTKEENKVIVNTGVVPNLKKFLDEYEASIDGYIAFIKNMKNLTMVLSQ